MYVKNKTFVQIFRLSDQKRIMMHYYIVTADLIGQLTIVLDYCNKCCFVVYTKKT